MTKAKRDRYAEACSMMASAWAIEPHHTGGVNRSAPAATDTAWNHYLDTVPRDLSVKLSDAMEERERRSRACPWPCWRRWAEMEAMLRTGWNPAARPTEGKAP